MDAQEGCDLSFVENLDDGLLIRSPLIQLGPSYARAKNILVALTNKTFVDKAGSSTIANRVHQDELARKTRIVSAEDR